MKTAKTLLALLLSLVLITSMMCISATAASGTAYLEVEAGKETVAPGDELDVTLKVDGVVLGGIDGEITYDSSKFQYVGAAFGAATEVAGRDINTCVANEDGVVKYVLIANGEEANDWLVLTFKALAAANDVEFGLDFVASSPDGEQEISPSEGNIEATPAVVDIEEEEPVVEDPQFDLIKAYASSYNTDEKPTKIEDTKLYFAFKRGADYGAAGVTIEKIGMLVALKSGSAGLEGRPLTVDADYKGVPIYKFETAASSISSGTTFGFISGVHTSTNYAAAYSARFYVIYKYQGETFITYSNDEDETRNITGGTISTSWYALLRKAAKAKYATVPAVDEIVTLCTTSATGYERRCQVFTYLTEANGWVSTSNYLKK